MQRTKCTLHDSVREKEQPARQAVDAGIDSGHRFLGDGQCVPPEARRELHPQDDTELDLQRAESGATVPAPLHQAKE
ncbi:hypothetical protein ACFCXF_00470 [Streptomyces virginiae]|uniref:hypothetical protein n=1 Tax=Streptomyces virginiae TaxID=1961 RepID=UPI0005242A5D|nr:hypothetical protein [Streptomyces virginiae]MCX4716783.1 hypothetical protein [Streptomyces virginiae]